MSEFQPVRTVADLRTLDSAEVMEGYLDGLDDAPGPGNNRSRSYWHGWRNGMTDRGRRPIDAAQRQLVHEVVASGYLRNNPRDSAPRHIGET